MLEAEVALLDEVEQVHALGQGVAAGDADDETEVGADEAVLGLGGGGHGLLEGDAALAVGELLGGLAACLDDARELPLVLGGEQGDLADVVQVEADGVVHDEWYNRSWWVRIRIRYCADDTGATLRGRDARTGWGVRCCRRRIEWGGH